MTTLNILKTLNDSLVGKEVKIYLDPTNGKVSKSIDLEHTEPINAIVLEIEPTYIGSGIHAYVEYTTNVGVERGYVLIWD